MNDPKITVEEIKASQIGRFIRMPLRIYADDRAWVPPLLSERKQFLNQSANPFFKHAEVRYFMAYRSGQPVGRIASIINYAHNEFHSEKVGFFGMYESIDDYIVSYGLLDKARKHAKESGMDVLRGPANFSTNDEVGCLIEGFYSPPVVMMPYNPQYYPTLFEKFGLRKSKDLYAYFFDAKDGFPTRVVRFAEEIKKRYSVSVRPINMGRFREEVALVKHIYNSAWEKNWGFIPMNDEEIDFLAKQLKGIIDKDLVLFAYVGNEPAGFTLAVPNINEILVKLDGKLFPTGIFKLFYYAYVKKIVRGARVITMGVLPQFRRKGIDTLLHIEALRNGRAKGYEWAELSWVLEDNTMMLRVADLVKAKPYKKYRIYDMEI